MYKGPGGIDKYQPLIPKTLLNQLSKIRWFFVTLTPDCQYRDGDKVSSIWSVEREIMEILATILPYL